MSIKSLVQFNGITWLFLPFIVGGKKKHPYKQGFESRTGPYGPTGKTLNRSFLRFGFYGLFRVKNRSIPKMQGLAPTVVRPSGFVNRDRFLRFERFLFVSAFPVNIGQYTGMKL